MPVEMSLNDNSTELLWAFSSMYCLNVEMLFYGGRESIPAIVRPASATNVLPLLVVPHSWLVGRHWPYAFPSQSKSAMSNHYKG